MSRALLVVPPLLKYAAGPLLGPAMLAGAAHDAGHEVAVVDLNIAYLRERMVVKEAGTSAFGGDHDKPAGNLADIDRAFVGRLGDLLPVPDDDDLLDHVGAGAFGHEAIVRVARTLAATAEGLWIEKRLGEQERPDLVGVSVLFGGQVYWALAASLVAKRLWPDVPVVWGGAHVTAISESISTDARFGRHVDGFVMGRSATNLLARPGFRAWRATVLTLLPRVGDRRIRPPERSIETYLGSPCVSRLSAT